MCNHQAKLAAPIYMPLHALVSSNFISGWGMNIVKRTVGEGSKQARPSWFEIHNDITKLFICTPIVHAWSPLISPLISWILEECNAAKE